MKRLKIINGVNLPEADNRGRAFPFKDSSTHFVGPALVNGQLYRMSVWLNKSHEGRSYVRAVFEEIQAESQVPPQT